MYDTNYSKHEYTVWIFFFFVNHIQINHFNTKLSKKKTRSFGHLWRQMGVPPNINIVS